MAPHSAAVYSKSISPHRWISRWRSPRTLLIWILLSLHTFATGAVHDPGAASASGITTAAKRAQADVLILLDNTRSMSLPINTTTPDTSPPPSRLSALQQGVTTWLDAQDNLRVGFMQYNTPGAAITEPIRDLNAPNEQVKIWNRHSLLANPKQRATGVITVLSGSAAPTFRHWDSHTSTERATAQWHRLQHTYSTGASLLKQLGLDINSTPFALEPAQITLVPFSETRLPAYTNIEAVFVEWRTVRAITQPVQLTLTLTPYNLWNHSPNLTELMQHAKTAKQTLTWEIQPQNQGSVIRSPNLISLLTAHQQPPHPAQRSETQVEQWAILIQPHNLTNTLLLKSTRQEDGTDEPLQLKLVTRHYKLFTAASVQFAFDYLPIPEGVTPQNISIHTPAWITHNGKTNAHPQPNMPPLTDATWFVQQPTPQSKIHPALQHGMMTNTNTLIDVFSDPHPRSASSSQAPSQAQHAFSVFESESLANQLNHWINKSVANRFPLSSPYHTFDPAVFYLILPESLQADDLRTLHHTLDGAPAVLSLRNGSLRNSQHNPNQPPQATDSLAQQIKLFQLSPSQLFDPHQTTTPDRTISPQHDSASVVLTFDRIPLRPMPATTPPNQHNAEPITRAWLNIPLNTADTANTNANAKAKAKESQNSFDLLLSAINATPDPSQNTPQLTNVYRYDQQHGTSISLDLTPMLPDLLGPNLSKSSPWHAGGSWRITLQKAPPDHHDLLRWHQAKLMIRTTNSATDPQIVYTAKQQLQHTLSTLQASMRGSLTDALLEASLYYAGQPPFFGLNRQRFPLLVGGADRRHNRLSHSSTIKNGTHIIPPGCYAIQPDNPACATETFVGNPHYDNTERGTVPQHLVIISDGVAPLNHSQAIASALTGQHTCYRDSIARPEQCGRTLAHWLSKPTRSDKTTDENQPRPPVTIHSIAFNTQDKPSRWFLYDLAQAGKGVYREASTPEELAEALSTVSRFALKTHDKNE
ncbi:MAG: hypothetical protein P8144_08555 [Gammaproteobacteria bacterium]